MEKLRIDNGLSYQMTKMEEKINELIALKDIYKRAYYAVYDKCNELVEENKKLKANNVHLANQYTDISAENDRLQFDLDAMRKLNAHLTTKLITEDDKIKHGNFSREFVIYLAKTCLLLSKDNCFNIIDADTFINNVYKEWRGSLNDDL